MISELPGVSLERVKESEESVADYSRRPRKKHRQEMALVARMMPDIATGGRVLDAPCGAGRLSVWMGRKGWRVSALDRGKAAVAHTRDAVAREGLEAEVLEGDIFRMPWRDRFFTAAAQRRVFLHLTHEAVTSIRGNRSQTFTSHADARFGYSTAITFTLTGCNQRGGQEK